jgi:hypothetical protein
MPSLLKFRSGNTNDLDSLFKQNIWFSALEQLNDPFEGIASIHCTKPNVEKRHGLIKLLIKKLAQLDKPNIAQIIQLKSIQEIYKQDINIYSKDSENLVFKIMEGFLKHSRDNLTIFSCSMRLHNRDTLHNPLMWAHYANSFKGFCLEFDYSILAEHLQNTKSFITGSPISYSDSSNTTELDNILESFVNTRSDPHSDFTLRPFFTKSEHWGYENEFRFILSNTGAVNFPKEALIGIYITNRTSDWIAEKIKHIIKNHYELTRLYLVKNDNFEYKISIEQLNNF